MRLPDDEHTGWDRLISAVFDEASDESSSPAPTSTGADDLVALLDLAALQERAGAGAADRGDTLL